MFVHCLPYTLPPLKLGRDVDTTITSLGGGVKVFHKYRKLFPGFAAHLTDRMVDLVSNRFVNCSGHWRADYMTMMIVMTIYSDDDDDNDCDDE